MRNFIKEWFMRYFCDKGNHKYKEVYEKGGDYTTAKCKCSICGEERDFTRIEIWAMSRGLPFQRTWSYDMKKKLEDFFISGVAWTTIVIGFLVSIFTCIAPLLIIIWILRHW